MVKQVQLPGECPWLKGMNPEQAAVVAHVGGPLYVCASAGSGKTRALVNRIARMVADGTDPTRILAVTFSKKAADEMNHRLEELGITEARVGTWHSLALQILRGDFHRVASFEIDDSDRHRTNVKKVCGYQYLDWKRADVTKVCSYIGICKANLWPADSAEAHEEARKRFGHEANLAVAAYEKADDLTEQGGLLTFDDMLVHCARHLAVEVNQEKWAARWDYVLQDEAQDANVAQMTIARALAAGHRNYMIVGDFRQAIYGFRGSTPQHFTAFPEEWGATVVNMCRNYRSGAAVLTAANAVCEAAWPGTGDMVCERGSPGAASAVAAEDLDEEARLFVDWLKRNREDGHGWSAFTALFRTNAQSRALEEALLGERIPYVVVGGTSFYERKEVKDLLAYLRVAAGRDRDGDAVKRCLNAPFRYLGAKFVERAMRHAEGSSDWAAVVQAAARDSGVHRRQLDSANDWASLVRRVEDMIASGAGGDEVVGTPDDARPSNILAWLVDRTGFIAWLTKDEGEESIENSRASNVRELVRVAGRFSTVTDLLDYIDKSIAAAKKQARQKTGDRVLLMSIHRSKGLEWPFVWVVGCNDGILPHAYGDPDEERRLFYVAVTRAQDEVVCSYVRTMATKSGLRMMEPSGFLADAGLHAGGAR